MFFTIGPLGDHYAGYTNSQDEAIESAGADALIFLGEVLLPEAYWDELMSTD